MCWTRKKEYFASLLCGNKIIQNSLQIDATHLYDNDLLLRQETQKRLRDLKADIITIKKNIELMSITQRMHFYWICSK